ncbi:hypothetical protein HNY73_013106 [Argiope bruennichi]|uniref:Uncharacterized protein n=1 Tax=Argiope bruennichi TaxID=94029 RepID=A0A8T0F2W5_ARGBR|nr:hypothetical protein HNY73_013106 [Argiope bruennichi]
MLPKCEPHCGPGETLRKTNNCDCCGFCVKMRDEGESCTPSALGPPPDPSTRYLKCQSGYKCNPYTMKCESMN